MNEDGIRNDNGNHYHHCTASPKAGRAIQEGQSIFDSNDPQFFLSDGNKHFICKRFSSAIVAYAQGIKIFEEGAADVDFVENEPKNNKSCSLTPKELIKELYCNRALSYLSIHNYDQAFEDTKKVLARDPAHFNAILRHTKAIAGLRQYSEAIKFVHCSIKVLHDKFNSVSGHTKASKHAFREQIKELQAYICRLKRMKQQSEAGELFEVTLIMEQLYEPAPADWVDYIGDVTVENIPGKGRGLVAAKDLPPATLFLACRAFEIIFLDGKTDPTSNLSEESKTALENGGFKIENDVTLNLLARKVYDRLVQNPERRKDFYELHAGNELGHLEHPDDDVTPPPLDMARIYGVCRTNAFANSGDSYPEVEKSVGIWLFPAFVNHQCIGANSTWKIFGDFIFVRTFKPVKKGEELTHSYVSPAYPFKARTEVLTKRLGFVCDCVLCKLDRELPPQVHEEKDKLKVLVQNQEVKFAQLDSSKDSPDYRKRVEASILLLEQIIAKLEKMQPKHGVYNASLLDPLQKLGLKYFGIGEFEKAVTLMERAVSLMKCCMLPHGVADCCLWIVAAYLKMGNMKLAKKWGKILQENLLLAYGDTQVLRILGPWAVEPMRNWGYYSEEN